MSKIIPIAIWPGGLINCFLIKGDQKHILVDTGIPNCEGRILRQLKRHKINPDDIDLIVVTHGHIDHFGSAASLKKIFGASILAHKADEPAYRAGRADVSTMKVNKPQWKLFRALVKDQRAKRFTPDIMLEEGEEYDLSSWGTNGKVIHTPGHTPGSLSVILANGEAIIMDMMASGILLGGVMFRSRIKHPPFHDNLIELKASFGKVLAEKCEQFYLGHGGPVNRGQVVNYYNKFLNDSA
ncbi:MBL fold metallo-hydrolase [Fulvivirga sp. 29W222]|uniref:MBL fold metallo-hydrolase n=1 Tax=Fulvivirga marina TaxID=2494733 RepID=A0A937G0L9_9BACT|nr:MBL fold metallo-hydrolase [Fulvivirga marina]MBL6447908.1 MBL fold metallo-hydrolase [Fulvivirga marina]